MTIDMPNLIITQASLADRVYENLKLLILSGTLKGGDRIPEEQLAQQFGVSRTPIREALKRLAEYGLVTLKPRINASVTSISGQEAADIARVRIALEKLALESLSKERMEDSIEPLTRLAMECQHFFAIGEKAKAFEKDSEFHIALIAGAGNGVLSEAYQRLDARIQLLRITQSLSSEELVPYAEQHMQLIRKIKDGNVAEAVALLEHHILHDVQE